MLDSVRFSSVDRYSSADFTPEVCMEPDDDTIGLWRFDEDMGTAIIDASEGGRDGVLRGSGASWVADGAE